MDETDDPPTSIIPPVHKQFSQVIFTDVSKVYTPNTDVKCKYCKEENFNPGQKAWIGIFKVGWQTTREYYTWVFASSSEEDTVLFKAYYLPKDDNDYQFCYVDHDGEVRGASVPFRFCSDTTDEDEDSIVMVTTEMEMLKANEEYTALKGNVEKLTEENTALQDKVFSLQYDNQSQADKIQTLEAELLTAAHMIDTLQKEKVDTPMELTSHIKDLEEEKEKRNKYIQSLELDLQKERSRQDKLLTKIMDMEISKTTNKEEKESFQELQNQVKHFEEEKEKLETEITKYKDNEQKLLSEKTEVEILLEKSVAEKNLFQSDIEAKQQAVEIVNGTFQICKGQVNKLRAELEVQAWTLENETKMKKKLQHSLDEEKKRFLDLECIMNDKSAKLTCAQETISNLHDQLAVQQVQMRTLENDKKQTEKLQGSLKQNKTALDAERKLQEQLRSTEEKMSALEQQLAQQQHENRSQRETIEVLRGTIEVQESENQEMKETERKHQIERDELHSRLLQIDMSGPTSQTSGFLFRNPYEGPDLGSSIEIAAAQLSNPLKCPQCEIQFQANETQVYQDHVMCHDSES
ncbi:calcium-binding and coiled-coil domain-containing protein 2 isoform X2 [Mixophyes fleayi]|uniref:calcium-binding and coiled-coil domain-containing protein 2 isoform X2 n=1 Tax=Mixophyes fleayi TaxID=3061075 RepID=UPI003F4D8A4C